VSRELDVRVAKALGQEKPPTWGEVSYDWRAAKEPGTYEGEEWLDTRAYRVVSWPPLYSTNIAAAWTLVEGCEARFYLERDSTGVWAMFGDDLVDGRLADTAPEAISEAWLAWKEHDNETE